MSCGHLKMNVHPQKTNQNGFSNDVKQSRSVTRGLSVVKNDAKLEGCDCDGLDNFP